MFQIDVSTAASTQPASTALGTVGYFTDGNAATGVPATVVPAEFLNSIMLEMMNTITGAGLTLSKSTFNQLLTAIKAIGQGGSSNYSVDYGSANAYAATYSPVVPAPTDGAVRAFKVKVTNTGSSTFVLDGSGVAYPIYGLNGTPLQGGELPANGIAVMRFNASLSTSGAWVLYHCGGGAQQLPAGSYCVTPQQFDKSSKLVNSAWVALNGIQASGVTPFTGALFGAASHIGGMVYCWSGTSNSYSTPNSATTGAPIGATVKICNFGSLPLTVVPQGADKVQTPLAAATTSLTIPAGTDSFATYVGGGVWFFSGNAFNGSSADFSSSLVGIGYQRLPSGLIIQWGASIFSTGGSAVSYPMTFPRAVFSVLLGNPDSVSVVPATYANSTSGFTGVISAGGSASIFWAALGY